MSANIFFIADTHFGHKNILTFEVIKPFRPFASIDEHDEELVRRWNSVVRKNDIVWHLGDFAFGRDKVAIAGRLNGVKKLVLGNHDTYESRRYLQHFHKLYGAVAYAGMLLTHIPANPNQFARHPDFINVHGHMHNRRVMRPKVTSGIIPAPHQPQWPIGYDMAFHVDYSEEPDPRYVCVSCEHVNLTPIALEELRLRINSERVAA